MKSVHYLGAHWQTFCGLILEGPVTPTADIEHTVGVTERGLLITYVRADVTCGRCLRGLRVLYPEVTRV